LGGYAGYEGMARSRRASSPTGPDERKSTLRRDCELPLLDEASRTGIDPERKSVG